MGVCGATNVTLRCPGRCGIVQIWSGPAYCLTSKSPSVSWATGDDLFCIRPRIADALSIQDNDPIDLLFESTGETFRINVRIKDKIPSDVIIHGMSSLNMIRQSFTTRYGEIVTFKSDRVLVLDRQSMWAGIRSIENKGTALMYFDGVSQNGSKGPCGYGFHILNCDDRKGPDLPELVEGYGWGVMDKSISEMVYEGLIEGLIWALRLDLARLIILGDSELVMSQLTHKNGGTTHLKQKCLRDKVRDMLKNRPDLEVEFKQIPREFNYRANNLANTAIAMRQKNAITVNWPNVNTLMAREN